MRAKLTKVSACFVATILAFTVSFPATAYASHPSAADAAPSRAANVISNTVPNAAGGIGYGYGYGNKGNQSSTTNNKGPRNTDATESSTMPMIGLLALVLWTIMYTAQVLLAFGTNNHEELPRAPQGALSFSSKNPVIQHR